LAQGSETKGTLKTQASHQLNHGAWTKKTSPAHVRTQALDA